MLNSIFNYKFRDPSLLETALTHPSSHKQPNYQKLEFLGDRILDFAIAEYVFTQYPDEKEGDLSKRHIALVCGEMIATIAKEHGLGDKVIMSYGEDNTGGRENNSNLEDVLEAIFAAIYLDSKDINIVKKIILELWKKHFADFKEPPQDPKSKLQEIMQKHNLSLPQYNIIKTEGPAHEPIFTMRLKVDGYKDIILEASNKKKGERELAKLMLENMGVDI